MIVVARNGKTTVYRGWRAWLLGAAATVAILSVLALVAVAMLGFALTIGLLMLLALPALILVAGLTALVGRLPGD